MYHFPNFNIILPQIPSKDLSDNLFQPFFSPSDAHFNVIKVTAILGKIENFVKLTSSLTRICARTALFSQF